MAYQYRGHKKNPPTIILGNVKGKGGRLRPKCGTPGGWNRHIRDHEYACDACREAHRIHRNPDSRRNARPSDPIQHGSEKGYQRELYRHIIPCDECVAAHAEARRERGWRTAA